jgi:hypothetical protein
LSRRSRAGTAWQCWARKGSKHGQNRPYWGPAPSPPFPPFPVEMCARCAPGSRLGFPRGRSDAGQASSRLPPGLPTTQQPSTSRSSICKGPGLDSVGLTIGRRLLTRRQALRRKSSPPTAAYATQSASLEPPLGGEGWSSSPSDLPCAVAAHRRFLVAKTSADANRPLHDPPYLAEPAVVLPRQTPTGSYKQNVRAQRCRCARALRPPIRKVDPDELPNVGLRNQQEPAPRAS